MPDSTGPAYDEDQSTKRERTSGGETDPDNSLDRSGSPAVSYPERAAQTAAARTKVTGDPNVAEVPPVTADEGRDNAFGSDFGAPSPTEPTNDGKAGDGGSTDVVEKAPLSPPPAGTVGEPAGEPTEKPPA